MGDKGGKKDNEKNKQQQLTKQNRRNKEPAVGRSPFTRDHEFRWAIIPGGTRARA